MNEQSEVPTSSLLIITRLVIFGPQNSLVSLNEMRKIIFFVPKRINFFIMKILDFLGSIRGQIE